MRKLLSILCLIVSLLPLRAQDLTSHELDSLVSLYDACTDSDTNKLRLCKSIAQGHYHPDSTIVWAERMVSLSELHNKPDYRLMALGYLAWAYFYTDEYLKSSEFSFRAVILADSLHNEPIMANSYLRLGDNYTFLNCYDKADSFYYNALRIYEKLQDSVSISSTYRSLAENYALQSLYEKSDELFTQAVLMDSMSCNYSQLCADFIGFAATKIVRYKQNFTQRDVSWILDAKKYALKAHEGKPYLLLRFALYDPLVFSIYSEIQHFKYTGNRKLQLTDSMMTFISEAYQIADSLSLGVDRSLVDLGYSYYRILLGDYSGTKKTLDSLRTLYDSNNANFNYIRTDLYLAYDAYYKAVGNSDSAYWFRCKYYELSYDCSKVDYAVKSNQHLAQIQFDDQLKQIQSKDRLSLRLLRDAVIVISVLLIVGLIGYLRKRKNYKLLNETNKMLVKQSEEIACQRDEIKSQSDELMQQNVQISEQNKLITDSITYASMIQMAALPKDELLKSMFDEYFLIYSPLNIVAGDFYWAKTIGRYQVLVCADSTGHGVPGAFVSMLGISLLNEICPKVIYEGGNAADILNQLKIKVMHSLDQSKALYEQGFATNKDGMDLSLIILDREKSQLQYAGALRPLWIFRNGELIKIKPDRMPIGLYLGEERSFTNNVVDLFKGDMLYMFSDGITDQFGYLNPERTIEKHFSTKRLFNLVTEIGPLPIDEQKSVIVDRIVSFMNGYKQMDDILFMGVRI